VARIQSEHPPDEAGSVIQRGRVLGGLEPSRAFGDARYKWSRIDQSRSGCNQSVMTASHRPVVSLRGLMASSTHP